MRLLSKSALAILVAKIEELAAVRVNLNLLTDKSVMKLAESLSLIQRNVKENKMMNRIHRASKRQGCADHISAACNCRVNPLCWKQAGGQGNGLAAGIYAKNGLSETQT